eukprot:Skav215508  [mRNA]  locus=scaffold165:1032157:1033324:- [translate_table: standard]
MWRVKLTKRSLGGVVLLSSGLCVHRAQRTWAEPRDVLVIGGTGLMGSPTVQLLQSQGHRVVVLSRGRERGQGIARPKAPQCDMVQCDRTEEGALMRELLKEKIVVDYTAMRPGDIEQVLAAHRQKPLQHYIFISTNMVYPGGPENFDGGRFRVVYSGDVAAAVAAVVRMGAEVQGEAFNVGGESMTMEEYVREMSDILKMEMPQLPEPSEDATVWNYEKQGEVDITKAVKLLNFKPTPLRDWLTETVMWHRPLLETSVVDKSCARDG